MTDSSHCSAFILDHGVRIDCMRLPNHLDDHRAGWHEWAAPDDQDQPEEEQMLCTMCEEENAATTWGAPVCDDCAQWLTDLDGTLQEMEAQDPKLKGMAQRVNKAMSYIETRNDE